MSQFHNTLPAEFEQEHGTTTLGADDQPIVELDEDLVFDLTHAQQRVWLVKVSFSGGMRFRDSVIARGYSSIE